MMTNVDHEIKDVDEWILFPRNRFFYDKSVTEAEERLRNNMDFAGCVTVANRLRDIALWWANVFLQDNYADKPFKDISSSNFLDHRFYFSKILITAIDTPGAGARVFANDIQHLFYLLLAFNRHEQALWLGGRTYLGDTPERFSGRKDDVWTLREVSKWESLGGDEMGWRGIVTRLRRLIPGQAAKESSAGRLPDDPMFPYWQEKPLCGYMLRLWLVMSGQAAPEQVPQGLPGCGVYEGLFENWSQPVALEGSIRNALDYHVRRSTEDGDGGYDVPEFSMRPYNVIPFEILAYRNVRRKMGLETQFPTHQLLDSPFVKNLPDELPPSDDPLLNEVIAAVRKVFSGVSP